MEARWIVASRAGILQREIQCRPSPPLDFARSMSAYHATSSGTDASCTPGFGKARWQVAAASSIVSMWKGTGKAIAPRVTEERTARCSFTKSNRTAIGKSAWEVPPSKLSISGENFTVEGLADADVCIGDRYQIRTAIFEVTQPRVTCYRVGIRTNEPRMALLLTSSGRPGFYFRVLQEGEIGAGDVITKLATGPEGMSVTQVNALLYSSEHPEHELERARSIPALSSGWRSSFDALLCEADGSGNAGLAPSAAAHPASPGFLALEVHETVSECADVISLTLVPTTSRPLTTPLPGQFVVLRLQPTPGGRPLFRSYSNSRRPLRPSAIASA